MSFIRNNWFKIGILILGVIYLFFMGINSFVNVRSHNLDIITQVRQCVKEFEDSDACVNKTLDQKVRIYKHLIW